VFGPAAGVVGYGGPGQLLSIVDRLLPSLAAAVHGEPDEPPPAALVQRFRSRVGLIVWNGCPRRSCVRSTETTRPVAGPSELPTRKPPASPAVLICQVPTA
jgi:hypothetical protein